MITNALDIAVELAEMPRLRVICTGGEVQPRYHTLAGSVTERVLKLHFFDIAVIGVSGIDPRYGFTVNSQVEAATVDLIAEHARTVVVVADRTKIGRVALAPAMADSVPERLVMDGPVTAEFEAYLTKLGICLTVVWTQCDDLIH